MEVSEDGEDREIVERAFLTQRKQEREGEKKKALENKQRQLQAFNGSITTALHQSPL
jgi:hypothetical protein